MEEKTDKKWQEWTFVQLKVLSFLIKFYIRFKQNYMKDFDEFNDSFLYQNVLSQQKVNYKMNLYRPAILQ